MPISAIEQRRGAGCVRAADAVPQSLPRPRRLRSRCCSATVNRDRVRARGAELEASWAVRPAWRSTARSPGSTSNSPTPLRNRPRWQGSLRAAWQAAPALELNAALRGNCAFFDSSIPTGLVTARGHVEADLGLRYRLGPRARLRRGPAQPHRPSRRTPSASRRRAACCGRRSRSNCSERSAPPSGPADVEPAQRLLPARAASPPIAARPSPCRPAASSGRGCSPAPRSWPGRAWSPGSRCSSG